jgi:endoglucanase
MLAGHLDEVGFLVKSVTREGFVKFLPLGGWWGHVVLGQRLVIRTR